ncbi:UDP-N-acetylmuramoyl-tripeptide--D-alanyl-D-alanine ligase [Verminephrobacter aporrectodeae subsp. tuberculatae]|uniref:UDP-N-acetylmuramoyl-tripeptide--D-alanyl-D-alanine ligase n=1 Tax=Verminephrobacter aporrectodeae subsp. tuberculatae TaxID=1110392 RepID=A0ABT3KS16_9BURK|nr:UDP-N-acetylmuramoyl-tripeptide--D-alanyl-D-alanine ligase [Verminephrobacter aporrectodeae]MCW5321055.1 UDP-N-acetylmuramoyl-tripeptide--D-alanyl-D-alanine ligase [Verminephrobacter aporrectodeae subsp. tuberculatae]
MLTLQQAHALLLPRIPTATLVGDGATPWLRVHTDTRTLQAGDLFVALVGARFDAHAFLAEARARGAAAALAQGGLQAAGLPGIEVPDSLAALGALAAGWRAQFELPLIGVTGSNGKTTVTQMIASILRAWHGAGALATQGNLNNHIGVALTLLHLRAAHRVAVVEMGMNHPGEIAALAASVRPTVALVNNAQREHLEFMQTLDAVARENGAVLASLPASGSAVFPAGDAYTALWRSLAAGRACLEFGAGGALDCRTAQWQGDAWNLALNTPQGPLAARLRIAGRHNLHNALAAAAGALAAGAPLAAIAQGLNDFTPIPGRSCTFGVHCAGRTITVVDDSYNANPDSLHAAVELLAELPAPQLLVLGDMGEVGAQGPQLHAQAGAHAHAMGISQLFALGAQSVHAAAAFGAARHFPDMDALLAAVREALPGVGSVLVKGSRFMQMKQVVQAIACAAPQNPDPEESHGATH